MKLKKDYLKYFLMFGLTVVVLVLFVILDDNFKNVGDHIGEVSPWWLAGAFGCMVLYYVADAASHFTAARMMGVYQSPASCMVTTLVGFFYAAITPFAAGGQPFQIVQMTRRKLDAGTGTSIMMLKIIGWHTAVCLMGAIGFGVLARGILEDSVWIFAMFFVGFIFHSLGIILGPLAVKYSGWLHKLGDKLIGLAAKTRWLKEKPEKQEIIRAGWAKYIGDYREAMKISAKHRFGMLCLIAANLAEFFAYMSVSYFVYRGLGFNSASYMTMVFTQSVLYISVALVPLPGASVANEGGFYSLFTKFFGDARSVGMLLWRVITYHMTIFIGLVTVFWDLARGKKHPIRVIRKVLSGESEAVETENEENRGGLMPSSEQPADTARLE